MRISALTLRAVPAHHNVSGAGTDAALHKTLLPYQREEFLAQYDVYVNDRLLNKGMGPSRKVEVYPGDRPEHGDLKFSFELGKDTKITLKRAVSKTSSGCC